VIIKSSKLTINNDKAVLSTTEIMVEIDKLCHMNPEDAKGSSKCGGVKLDLLKEMAGYLGLNKSLSKHKLVDSIQQK
jgi:hypothetical protein